MSKINTRVTINANIKQNGNQEITGQILNSVLNAMVDDYAEQEKLTELESEVKDIKTYRSLASYCSFEGKGSTFSVGSDRITNILPKIPIKLHIENPSISMEGITAGNRLQVWLINSQSQTERTILAIGFDTELAESYTFIPNDGEDSLRIGGRCAAGEIMKVYVEQKSTFDYGTFMSNVRLVNNAAASEYDDEGSRVYGFYRLDKSLLSVRGVLGTAYTAASAFYDAAFNPLGVYNTNNNGEQSISLSYADILEKFPSAEYVRFTSNIHCVFEILSGCSTNVIPSELAKVSTNNTHRINDLEIIAKQNIIISDSLSLSHHNIYVDSINSNVVIKKEGFIVRVHGKKLVFAGSEDLLLSYSQDSAPEGAYIIPMSVIDSVPFYSERTIPLTSDNIKYVSRYSQEYVTSIILFTTYYGNLVAEGLFAKAIKVSGDDVLDNAFTGAYITQDVHPAAKRFASLFNGKSNVESFIFFTDQHLVGADNDFSKALQNKYNKYIGTLQKFYNSSPSDFIVSGGDWLINNDSNDVACYKLGYVDATMNKLFKNYYTIVGNHDYNYLGTDNEDLTADTIKSLWFRKYEHPYYEFKGTESRCFMLDTGIDQTTAMDEYRWGQIDWLGNRLMENTDEHILVFQHIYKQGEQMFIPPFADNVLLLLSAFNSRGDIWLNGIHYDFATAKGRVACVIAGHQHKDAIYNDYSVPVFVTTTFNLSEPTFDMILIDYNNNKLHSVRVGIGEDREMNLA